MSLRPGRPVMLPEADACLFVGGLGKSVGKPGSAMAGPFLNGAPLGGNPFVLAYAAGSEHG